MIAAMGAAGEGGRAAAERVPVSPCCGVPVAATLARVCCGRCGQQVTAARLMQVMGGVR